MTKWEALKEYINSRPIGTVITRKKLLRSIEKRVAARYITALDSYRIQLKVVGVLETVKVGSHILFGSYRICFHIKDSVTTTQLKRAAKTNSWENWFYDIKVMKN